MSPWLTIMGRAKPRPAAPPPSKETLQADWTRTIVASLQTFGYPSADASNVVTDPVYSAIFRQQLAEGLSHVKPGPGHLRSAIEEMVAKIDEATKKNKETAP